MTTSRKKDNQYFKQKLIAAAVTSALSASAVNVHAQTVLEELVVTGIRGSMKLSQDIKRDSNGVVDAISAEDIGKFPDSNIAESLQRIPGVSINRRNGEGSQVTVRGFGPDFNMITLNGRMMPSASITSGPGVLQGGDAASRAFNMDNIASEGIAGVEVYKTSKAGIASGGIGATVNLKTTRPLDTQGLKVSVGAKALRDTTNEQGSDTTPELSGLFSWSNDTFGVSLSASQQERDSGSAGAFVDGWGRAFIADGTNNLPQTNSATNVTNTPAAGLVTGEPSDLRLYQTDTHRERTNAQLTLQFRPTESITTTLDYTFAEQITESSNHTISQWFQDFPRADIQFDQEAVPTPVLLWEESSNGVSRDTGSAQAFVNEKNELDSLGLNVEWDVNDSLKLAFDLNNATNKAGANSPFGSAVSMNMAVNGSLGQGADFTGDIPTLYINYDDSTRANQVANGTADGIYTADDIGSQILQVADDYAETEVSQYRIDGTYDFSDESSIDFGIERREMENITTRAQTNYTLGDWSVTQPGDIPDGFLRPIDYGALVGVNTSNQSFFDAASGGTAVPFTQGFGLTDIPEVGRQLLATYQPGTSFDASSIPVGLDRKIKEDITAAYFQFNMESSLDDMPVSIVAGLRYEDTDVSATSLVAPTTVRWESDDDFRVITGSAADAIPVTEDASYSHMLPSLDIAVDITESVKARFSYGRTIARPRYGFMNVGAAPTSTGPSSPTILGGSTPPTAASGSAGVLPLESDNLDISLEWYFDDSSYVSAGLFEKRVSNFIGSAPVARSILGILDPTNGPRTQTALTALNSAGIETTDFNLFSMMVSQTAQAQADGLAFADLDRDEWISYARANLPGGGFTGEAGDSELIWNVSTPANINNAKLYGLELAGQHFFGDSGFGVAANYTIVNGNVGFDVTGSPSTTQFALLGLSDTANLSLIYEKYGFQGRISYNWRDGFLDNAAITANEPRFTEEYEQIDISLSYEVSDSFFVSLEGINITDENQRTFGRSERQVNSYNVLGARYALGVRYTF